MILEKTYYVEELWQQFKHKIASEWEKKYDQFGSSPSQIIKLTQFSRAVHKDIKLHAKRVELFDEQTLYQYLKSDGISLNSKSKTLEVFSVYLGYLDWDEFCKRNESLIRSKQKIDLEGNINTNNKTAMKKVPYSVYALILITLFFLGFMAWWLKNKSSFTDVEKAYFKGVIEGANNSEIKAYASLPNVDTAIFDLYFMNNSKARNTIISRIERRADSFLLDKSSHYNLLHIEYVYKKDKEVRLETQETWRILWVNRFNKSAIPWTATSKQYYILKKDGTEWKIDLNEPYDVVHKK